jgi:crossover junction endodeoxyribonuclease RuvC
VRVLGVDPGLSRCGVGVVDGPPAQPRAVRAGVVRTPAEASTARRLSSLYEEITALLADTAPQAVAVERTFFNVNVSTAMGVGQAAGVVLLAAAQADVPVVEYTPTQVKSSVAGHGAADKDQVGYMVRVLLRLGEIPRPADAADALALALCHLQRAGAHDPARMSPRLAAAAEVAQPGAQVIRRPGAPPSRTVDRSALDRSAVDRSGSP